MEYLLKTVIMIVVSGLFFLPYFWKAGIPLWVSFVPFYNTYIFFKMLELPVFLLVFLILLSGFPKTLSTISMLIMFIIILVVYAKIGTVFGQSSFVGIIAIFFPFLLIYILWSGHYEGSYVYGGNKDKFDSVIPPKQPVPNQVPNSAMPVAQSSNVSSEQMAFCPQCGSKVEADFKMCMRCGYQRPV